MCTILAHLINSLPFNMLLTWMIYFGYCRQEYMTIVRTLADLSMWLLVMEGIEKASLYSKRIISLNLYDLYLKNSYIYLCENSDQLVDFQVD